MEFLTDRNLIYEIYTQPGTKIIPGFVFTADITYFGFYAKGAAYKDSRVMPTIMNFMLDLLEEPNAIVAYIYSAAGQQDKARERYFNSLFNKYCQEKLNKTDFQFGDKDGTASIIYRNDNINIEALCSLTAEQVLKRIEIKDQFEDYA